MTVECAFSPGEKIFAMIDDKARELTIYRVEVRAYRSGADILVYKTYYCSNGRFKSQLVEPEMFKTQEELVKAILSEL